MAENPALFSPLWHRVARLKPRLRPHVQIHRHVLRGKVWYILQDHASGRIHRFSPAAYQLIGLMDGRRTLQEIWLTAAHDLGDDCPTQDECLHLLMRLHNADALQSDVAPDIAEIAERSSMTRRRNMLTRFRSPLAIRIPLVDPDAFLQATAFLVRPFFNWFGALIWIAIVIWGVLLAVTHWGQFTADIADRVLAADNLVLLWLCFPVVKAIHELGHGYAAKIWGGEVHEMGIMFLVFVPVPYVEASSSSAFPEKWKRMIVGAGGVIAELPIAAVALWVWIEIEPGFARAIAYNVVLIAGVSTLFFNGNPLLKFDGYYVLMDFLEMPNLGPRANKFIGYLTQRYMFRVAAAVSPADAPGEPVRLLIYGVASFLYRIFIMTVIVMFVATKFFAIGVVLAIWSVGLMIVWPVIKMAGFLLRAPILRERRTRAIGITFAAAAVVLVALMLVPAPYATMTEGVVWVPERSMVRTGVGGFVREVAVQPGQILARGQTVVEMSDPVLAAEVRVLEAQLRELEAQRDALVEDPFGAQIAEQEMHRSRERLDRSRQRLRDLTVLSPGAGLFMSASLDDLPGRYLAQGDLVGYVMDFERPVIRVAVPASDIDLLRENTRAITVRLSQNLAEVVPARVSQIAPAATSLVPNAALTARGGGKISIDPTEAEGNRSLEDLFHVELIIPRQRGLARIGGRAYVKFDHGYEPLGLQMYRRLRQLFLKQFDV